MNYELIIVGAGPAGISMGVEAVRNGIPSDKILILEKSDQHSSSVRKLYPEKKLVMANYKGKTSHCEGSVCIQDMSKEETLQFFDQQVQSLDLKINYSEEVHKIQKDSSEFKVETKKNSYTSKVVVIAIGVFGKPNKPKLTIPSSLRQHVLYDITSQSILHKKCLVVGGGDSASEYVQFLIADHNEVTLSYRKNNFFRMNPENNHTLQNLIDSKKITLKLNSNIEEIVDINGKPNIKFVERGDSGQLEEFDKVIFALGGSTPINFLKTIGVQFNEHNEPLLTDDHETNVKGLFLVGDLVFGKKGGSIISAFNSSHQTISSICQNHLSCDNSFKSSQE